MRPFGMISMLVVAGAIGCSKSTTVPVTGKVTFKGQPATKAEVTFMPKEGRPASGVVDAQGNFTLTTNASGDGAVPGEHTVVVTERVPPEQVPVLSGTPMPPSIYPAKYGDATQTPFRATVERGKKNEFLFEMKD